MQTPYQNPLWSLCPVPHRAAPLLSRTRLWGLLALAFPAPLTAGAQRQPSDTLRVAVAEGLPADARRGAIMSIEESARVAPLLGRAVMLDSSAAGMAYARFVIAAGEAALPPRARAIVLDLGCAASPATGGSPPGAPRAASARRFTLCAPPASGAATPDSLVAWDATLEKFGASQLNDRYRARWKAPMSEVAWRGWLAAKIAWESSLRGPREPDALPRWLASPAARFDGHQGVPLSFDARHRLRHPQYRVLHRGGARTLERLP